MFSIIVSKLDRAGMNIARHLIEEHGFKETCNSFDSNKVFELKEKQLSKVDYYKAVLSLYTSQEIIDETVKELSDALYRAWLIAKGTK